MAKLYLQVYVSAENREQADAILDSLLKEKLTCGGLIINGPAKFWWKGEITKMVYYNISAFTIKKHKQSIIERVKKVSIEEVPMIWFVPFDGNKEFTDWIEQNIK